MSEGQSVIRTEIVIDGESVLLDRDQAVDDLKRRIEAAAATPGAFVEFVAAGGRSLSVLVTPRTRVTIIVSRVVIDEAEPEHVHDPLSSLWDFSNDLG